VTSPPAPHALRRALRASQSAVLLVAMMFLGSLVLWVGVPVAWLWIGSRLQENASLSTAIGVMMLGMLVSITVLLAVLGRLSRLHTELQEQRGVPEGETTALELVLVSSAVIAVVGFFVWFFGFSGSSPIPLNISY
jgi:heme/copper-type cytochrome/quinol oxidase subunit 2